MRLIRSIIDIKNNQDRLAILNKSTVVSEVCCYVSSKYIHRGNYDVAYIDKEQVIVDADKQIPELSKDHTVAVLEFYQNKLTNYTNRLLANRASIITLRDNIPIQTRVTIDEYDKDMPKLIEYSETHPYVSAALEKFKIDYAIDFDSSDNIEAQLDAFFLEDTITGIDDEPTLSEALPLTYLEKFNFVYNQKLPKLDDNRLSLGETLTISTKTLDTNVLDSELENILYSDDICYMLTFIREGTYSIRKFNIEELDNHGVYDYNL